jgi:hypothetical protein
VKSMGSRRLHFSDFALISFFFSLFSFQMHSILRDGSRYRRMSVAAFARPPPTSSSSAQRVTAESITGSRRR